MIIKATSHTIRNIWMILLFILLVFSACIATLFHGISLDSLSLPKLKIEQLYIKLDKKLFVTIEHLRIDAEANTQTSLEDVAFVIEHLATFHQVFDTLRIANIDYAHESLSFDYTQGTFRVKNADISADMLFTPTSRYAFDVNLSNVCLKEYSLTLEGKASLDFKKEEHSFEGMYELFGIKGIALIDVHDTLLTYHIQTENFTNQALSDLVVFLAPKVELDPIAKAWIHENIIARDYLLHFVEGKFDLKNYDYFPYEIRGSATVMDANVSFHPQVPAAHVDKIGILFENDKLIFDVQNPYYQDKKVDKADVYIYNLIGKGTGIVVDLFATARLDKEIHKILHAFNIDVPITQTSGKTEAEISLDIKFLPYDINATGSFKLSPSDFMINTLPLQTHFGTVRLDNRLVYLDKTNIRYKNLFDINATGVFDTTKERFDGEMDINTLALDFGKAHLLEINALSHQKGSLGIDANGTLISLPDLNVQMLFGEENNDFILSSLLTLQPYSPFMKEMGLSHGEAVVQTKDFERFDANLSLFNLDTPLLDNAQNVKDLFITLSTDTKTLDLSALNSKLSLHMDEKITLHVNDINLSISENDNAFETPIAVELIGNNSSILIQDSNKTILSDHYTIVLKGQDLLMQSQYGKAHFEYEKKKDEMYLHVTSMNDHFVNALLGNTYFSEGDFSLQLEGINRKENHGTFIMQKSYIKDLKFFNNLMATINAIPSLIIFKDPSFSQEGYFVHDGYIDFEQKGDEIIIKDMLLRGNSADIVGFGSVNNDTNQVNLKLQIRTLKTFSSVLDMIPLVGGLILGEDKRISTHVQVTGHLDDPKIQTNVITDTLMSPLNIIKRTLELPLELFK
jgi:hypothetical protein